MKKVISAIIACVFVLAMATVAFAADSPIAPTIPSETTTAPTTTEPTTEAPTTTEPTDKPSEESSSKPDVDETTTSVDETTTKQPVTSDTNPSSPDTGVHVGEAVSAAAFVAVALGGAFVYTSKKKAE